MTILIALAIGMSLLLLCGVLIVLSSSSGMKDRGIAVVGLVVVAGADAVLVRRDLLVSLIGSLVRSVKRLTGRPRDEVAEGIASTLGRIGEIPLKTTSTLEIIGSATWV